MTKKKLTDEPKFLDVPAEEDEPDRLERVWRDHLPEEADPDSLDQRAYSYFMGRDYDGAQSRDGQSKPPASPLEGRTSDHAPIISLEERTRRTKWAYIALLRERDWQGTLFQMMQILDRLKQEGYPGLTSYEGMRGENLVDYFEKVCGEIGGDTLFYCWDIGAEIREKNREVRMTKKRTS